MPPLAQPLAPVTVNTVPLLVGFAIPATVTTTLPVVARDGTFATMLVLLQLTIVVAFVPLKVTVLLPWDDPKFEPVIVTELPIAAEVGLRLEIWGPITVKVTLLLLATPPTATTTGPAPSAAPEGTLATMLVSLQLVMEVAFVPLKVTVLEP